MAGTLSSRRATRPRAAEISSDREASASGVRARSSRRRSRCSSRRVRSPRLFFSSCRLGAVVDMLDPSLANPVDRPVPRPPVCEYRRMDAAVVTELRGQGIVRVLRAGFAAYGLVALLWIPLRNVGSDDFSTAD